MTSYEMKNMSIKDKTFENCVLHDETNCKWLNFQRDMTGIRYKLIPINFQIVIKLVYSF